MMQNALLDTVGVMVAALCTANHAFLRHTCARFLCTNCVQAKPVSPPGLGTGFPSKKVQGKLAPGLVAWEPKSFHK